MDANRSRLHKMFKKFKLRTVIKIFTYLRLSTISNFLKSAELSGYTNKLDALTQSGFVYTSYAAAATDMGMHVSRYVASC